MTYTTLLTESRTFTVTHAEHIAAKVATDLLRLQRFYGRPADTVINDFEKELVQLLKHGYLDTIIYGFEKADSWVVALRYHTTIGSDLVGDDDPGQIRPGQDINGAIFSSFLKYNNVWGTLSHGEREAFKRKHPIQRISASEPGIRDGFWETDRTYSAGGRAVRRSTLRRY